MAHARKSRSGREAQLKAARFDRDAAQHALATSIVRAYAQLAGQYDMQDVLLATQRQRQEIIKMKKAGKPGLFCFRISEIMLARPAQIR